MLEMRNGSVAATVLKWVCALVVGAILVYTMVDYGVSGENYVAGYLKLNEGSPVNVKAAFLTQYQTNIEQQMQKETTEDSFSSLYIGEISISAEIFTETAVRLNMEIYAETAATLTMFNTDKYFGGAERESPLVTSLRENLSPMQVLCLAASESGNWSDRRYNWVPAVFSKGMTEDEMEGVHIWDVDSGFYIGKGLTEYFQCGSASENHIGNSGKCKLHYSEEGSSTRNDADSLGPMQVLRRYMQPDQENANFPDQFAYHLDIDLGGDGEGRETYRITDLMKWSDSIAWTINNFLGNVRDARGSQNENVLENEYEVMCLFAITHNTGQGFLSSSDGPFSGWASREAIYKFCKDVTSPEAIAYLMEEYVDPWYEDVVVKIAEGSSWNLPGNESLEGRGDGKDEVMKELLRKVGASGISEESSRLDCEYWVGANRGLDSDHKFRYPVKTLLNYLALQRLYYSGIEG